MPPIRRRDRLQDVVVARSAQPFDGAEFLNQRLSVNAGGLGDDGQFGVEPVLADVLDRHDEDVRRRLLVAGALGRSDLASAWPSCPEMAVIRGYSA
jgi:hypothetical protein